MRRRIVVVNWRRSDLTLRALRSVLPQMGDGDRLVVVDNGSGDDSTACLRSPKWDLVETGRNLGFGGGVNAGARGMDEDALVLLNNDAVAQDGFLDAITSPLGGRVGATTGKILLSGTWVQAPPGCADALVAGDGSRWTRTEGGTVLVNSTGNVLDSSGNGSDRDWLEPEGVGDAPAEVFGFCGGACAILREAWDQVGPFREDFFMYYEDTELSWRLREAGWDIVHVPGARTVHDHAASSGTNSPMFLRVNARNRILVAILHGPVSMVVQALARTVGRTLQGPDRGPVLQGLGEAVARMPRTLVDRVGRARGISVGDR
ncbi:glycosyltransferase family 2 protein [Schaalia naturae]|uniref:Glycosyltransferase family 2 protein n=1 Tax=Schaalia naturae TaxID=635203 RepID=A0ABW2SJ46_9ACTO